MPAPGFYGNDPYKNVPLAGAVEVLAIAIFAFGVTAVGVIFKLFASDWHPVTTSLIGSAVSGATLLFVISMFGHNSGAPVNPAADAGLAVSHGSKFVMYFLMLFVLDNVGSYFGVGFVGMLFGTETKTVAKFAAPQLSGIDIPTGMIIEGVLTAVFVLCIIQTATDPRAKGNPGVPIGTALFVLSFIGSLAKTGGSLNPAIALMKIVHAGLLDDMFWETILVYVVAPIIGGIIAGMIANVIKPADNPAG
jgi:glycerol uptake facilitator-like aquaporin